MLTETFNGKTTTHEYDALGRRVLTTDADGRETQFEYGNDGRLSRVIDGEGNATEYLYDALGRLVLTIAADGGTTEQRYDAAGNLLALIDPIGNVTSWLYDRTYRVVAEIDPLGETESVSYDLVGRPAVVTDRLGRQKVYTYTDGGRIASEAWYDDEDNLIDTLSYIYNDDGRLYTASNAAGTYTFTYDDLGRVATVQDINGITLTYGWDEVDDLVTLSDSEGGAIASEYDEAHRLIERSQSGTGVESLSIQIDYDTEGRRGELRRYSDATGTTLISSTEYGHDNAGNLTSLIHKDDVGDPLVTYSNTFDDNNRITSETRNSVTLNYEYDDINQVVDDDTNEYSYDLNGNRTMTGYTTGAGNRIETDGTWTYEYDLEGNLIKKSMGEEAETWEYGYNHNNQMIWAEKRATDGGTLQLRIDYMYDVFGNLVERTVTVGETETTTSFAYDVSGASIGIDGHINPLWAELDEEGDITVRFLLGDYVGEKLARSGPSIDTAWLLHDRLGSLREVLDEEGALVNSIAYDAFGNITSETDDDWTGNFAWQGLLLGREEDIHWAKYRGVLSNGQWTGEDLLSFAAGDVNLRRVVGNNGMNWIDPSGLDWDAEVVFSRLSRDEKNQLGVLSAVGWRFQHNDQGVILSTHDGDISAKVSPDGVLRNIRNNIVINANGVIEVKADSQWDLGKDAQWEVNFSTKRIWIDTRWDGDATAIVKKLIPLLYNAYVNSGKPRDARNYDIDLHSGQTTLECYNEKWAGWLSVKFGDKFSKAPTSVAVRRQLITMLKLEWNSAVQSAADLAQSANYVRPGPVLVGQLVGKNAREQERQAIVEVAGAIINAIKLGK